MSVVVEHNRGLHDLLDLDLQQYDTLTTTLVADHYNHGIGYIAKQVSPPAIRKALENGRVREITDMTYNEMVAELATFGIAIGQDHAAFGAIDLCQSALANARISSKPVIPNV